MWIRKPERIRKGSRVGTRVPNQRFKPRLEAARAGTGKSSRKRRVARRERQKPFFIEKALPFLQPMWEQRKKEGSFYEVAA
ncbi:MAG: hypothetical protein ACLR2E_05660 [Lachnospiraceae bacterium]